jgi:hypothetical protein
MAICNSPTTLALLPVMPARLTANGLPIRVCISIGSARSFPFRTYDDTVFSSVSQLYRMDGRVVPCAIEPLYRVKWIGEGSDGRTTSNVPESLYELAELCYQDVFGAHFQLLGSFMGMECLCLKTSIESPQAPLIIVDGSAYEAECTRVECNFTLDSFGQLPEFTATSRWHLGILQRANVINRKCRLEGTPFMEPAGIMNFFAETLPQAYRTPVATGCWLPASLRGGPGHRNEDVIVKIGAINDVGKARLEIWSKKPQLQIEAGWTLERELHWEEHQQWNSHGDPTDAPIPVTAKWIIATII